MTLATAFFADIKCINWGLVKGGFVSEGILGLLYIGTIGVLLILALLYNRRSMSRLISYPLLLSLILVIFYQFTLLFDGKPSVSIDFFFVFTIAAILIPQIMQVDAKLFVLAIMFFPSFSIFRIDLIFQSYLDWMNVISMDASYGYLVPIVANIVYLFEYFSSDSLKRKVLVTIISIINLIIFIQLFLFGSRGPLLAIFLLVAFLWTTKINNNKVVFHKRRIKFLFLMILILIISFQPILLVLNDYLSDKGISVYAIEKIINLSQEGDISNGRSGLNEISLSGFLDSPLWGNGIARFYEKSKSSLEYPHNFILQLLYDGGIILFSFVLIPAIRRLKALTNSCSHDRYVIFCTLFFASVPGALLSQDMWNIPVLWLCWGFLMSNTFVHEYEYE